MTALIYCPFPDRESAEQVGKQLLDEGLIGCINIGTGIHAFFVWNGERGSGEEIPVLCKTDAQLLSAAITRLEDLHPYDTPAIVGWPCEAGAATRDWLGGLKKGSGGDAD